MCLPLKWIDGHSETKEKLLREPVEQYDIKDYNETLHELIRSKQTDQIETIKLIKDKKIRAIASMLNVELTIKDISILFKCHTKTVRRWIHIKYLQ
jgi:hypothetical protein